MAQTKAQLLGPVVGDVVMDVSTLSLDAEGNKVGIGTTEADLTLHVNGVNALPSSSGSTPTGHLTLRAKASSSSHGMFMGVSNAAPWSSWIQAQDANNNATTYPLLLNPNGGNVGIGLTNPFGKLQVRPGTNANFSFTTGGGESSLELINDAGSANVPLNVRASEYKIKIQGNEKLRITSAGDVRIGPTGTPGFGVGGGLEVERAGSATIRIEDTSSSSSFEIQNTGGVIKQRLYNNQPWIIEYGGGEALRITSAGLVGINNASPATVLDIKSTKNGDGLTVTKGSNVSAFLGHNGSGDEGLLLLKDGGATKVLLYAETNQNSYFNSGGNLLIGHNTSITGAYDNSAQTKQVQIVNGSNDGNQGLGIYSYSSAGWAPRIELATSRSSSKGGHTVVTDGQSCGLMVFNGSDGTDFSTVAMIGSNVNGTPANNAIPGSLSFYTSPGAGLVERLRIDSTGRTLIHTSTSAGYADRWLSIGDVTDASSTFEIRSSPTNGYSSIVFTDATSADSNSYIGAIEYAHQNNTLAFKTNATERLRITSAGGVTIGSGNNDATWSEFGSNTGGLKIDDVGVSNTGLRLSHGNDDTYLVQASNSNFYISQYGTGSMVFGVGSSGNERLRITSAGIVHVGSSGPSSGAGTFNVKPASGVDSYLKLRPASEFDGAITGTAIDIRNASNGASQHLILRAQEFRFWCDNADKIRFNSEGHFNSGNLTVTGRANNGNASITNYTQVNSDNHANTFFGQNIKLGANGTSGDHTLRIINQHSSIGGAGIYIGGNGSGRQNTINFYAESANQASTTDVTANAKMTLNTNGQLTTMGEQRIRYHTGSTDNKTSKVTTALGKSGTYTTCTVTITTHSYCSVAYDIAVGGYSAAHAHRTGTYYINNQIYGSYTSTSNSGGGVSASGPNYVATQKSRWTFSKTNGFVHPICSITVASGGDGYINHGDISIVWS